MSIWQDDEFDDQGNERPVGNWGIEEDDFDFDPTDPESFAKEMFRQAKEDEEDLSPFDLDS